MINILTALQNEEINYELKKNKDFTIEYDDIQYEEGLIEILKTNKDIGYIVFNKKILEKNKLEDFIKIVLDINKEVKIILIYNNEEEIKQLNNNIKQLIILIKNNYNIENKTQIVKEIENKIYSEKYLRENYYLEENEKMKKEISNLKRIIEKNNVNLNKLDNSKHKDNKGLCGKIVSITGARHSGKTIITAIISKIISKSKKVLIIDMDFESKDMKLLFNVESYNIQKDRNIVKEISKNLDIICDMNIALENIKNLEDNLDRLFIRLKEKYDYIFIDLSEKSNMNIFNYFLDMSNYIFLLIEGNILNMKKSKIMYENILRINSNINIILNKNNKYSIDKLLINKLFNSNIFRSYKL